MLSFPMNVTMQIIVVQSLFNVIRSLWRIKKKLLLFQLLSLTHLSLYLMHAVLISDAYFALQCSVKRETIKTHYLSNYSTSAGSQNGIEKRGPCNGDQERESIIKMYE